MGSLDQVRDYAIVEAPTDHRDKWVPFELASVEPYNHNTKVYHFKFPEDSKDKVSGIPVAGALLVKTPEGENEVKDDKGKPVIRCDKHLRP